VKTTKRCASRKAVDGFEKTAAFKTDVAESRAIGNAVASITSTDEGMVTRQSDVQFQNPPMRRRWLPDSKIISLSDEQPQKALEEMI
jgi:hypothetical protein